MRRCAQMATREGPLERARRGGVSARARVGEELRRARRASGLSQSLVARACHVSASQVCRIENGVLPRMSVQALLCIADVVGLSVAIRTYPGPDAVRDAGHARLLERFRRRLHPALRFRTEVPLPISGDRRAWDAVVTGQGWQLPIEAETVIDDLQAIERKLGLKLRDGGFDHVVLVVSETPRNRAALRSAPMAAMFPVTAVAVESALRAGRDPGGSGIVIL